MIENAFSGYTPQLSWQGHDKCVKYSVRATKIAIDAKRLALPGSVYREGRLIDIPSRDSVNTEQRTGAEKTAQILRGRI